MELTELMVGDWVFVSGNPVKITKDDLATMLIFLDDDSKLSPIPLTEDILVKNDFDRQYYDDGNSYWWAVFDGWFNINLDHKGCIEGGFSCVQNRDLVINSVHQLQHLLRLVGVQKEIEL